MWLYYNQSGTLLEQIDANDSPARVGQDGVFKFFAYFEGINLSDYTTATIKLQKPNLEEYTYPDLFLANRSFQFTGTGVTHFKKGSIYSGFEFIMPDILTTAGLWRATITLFSAGGRANVVGMVQFNVQTSVISGQEALITHEEWLEILEEYVATKLPVHSGKYIHVLSSLPSTLSDDEFAPGMLVFNIADKTIRSVVTLDPFTSVILATVDITALAARVDAIESKIPSSATSTNKLATASDVDGKVSKVTTANKVYGTDSSGNPTTYDKDSFGAVNDVKVNNVSVVTNKVANINLTGKLDKNSTPNRVYFVNGSGQQEMLGATHNVAPLTVAVRDGNGNVKVGTAQSGSDAINRDYIETYHDSTKVDKTTSANKIYGTDGSGAPKTYDKDSFGMVDDVKVNNVSVVTNKVANIDLSGKLDKVSSINKVYGTDGSGNQTTYDKNSFGQVDDVQISCSSIVSNKIANMPLADASHNGAMAKESVTAIQTLTEDVAILKGQTVRLLYTTKDNPNATEIESFVIDQGYTDRTKWNAISVVVKGTNHIWRCTSSTVGSVTTYTWTDMGIDTVNRFTNQIAGIIKGSATDGKVYAEDDGTGSVYGWDTLKGRVTAVENGLLTKLDKTGGTMTGDLIMSAQGSNNLSVSTKGYVDSKTPTIEEVGY